MKWKKYNYLILLILILFIGINGVYALDQCESYFGTIDPNDGTESFREIMQEILMLPKIAVPAIIIGLGALDLSKAVIASKEDEMKKAQTTFIKRIFIGICIFFVPTIVNVLMIVADLLLGTDINCLR